MLWIRRLVPFLGCVDVVVHPDGSVWFGWYEHGCLQWRELTEDEGGAP